MNRYKLLFYIKWASLVAQMVKNLPVVWETWVHSLGWEDLLEEGMATSIGHAGHAPVFLPGESPWTEELGGLHGVAKSLTRLSD